MRESSALEPTAGGGAWVWRPPSPEERAAELMEIDRAYRRQLRRDLSVTALYCLFWLLCGLALIGWSFHTTDQRLAGVAFWAGLLVGDAGLMITLGRAVLRAERGE